MRFAMVLFVFLAGHALAFDQKAISHTVDFSELAANISKKALKRYTEGLKAKEEGKPDEAARLMKEAIRLAPGFDKPHNDLGLLYYESGRLKDAENELMHARELNPRAPEPLINLGVLYIARREFENAILLLNEAAEMSPPHPKAFFNLGIALYNASRYNDAEKALRKAQQLDRNIPALRLILANVYIRTRAYDKAVQQLDGYLQENPNGKDRAAAEETRSRLLALTAGAPDHAFAGGVQKD